MLNQTNYELLCSLKLCYRYNRARLLKPSSNVLKNFDLFNSRDLNELSLKALTKTCNPNNRFPVTLMATFVELTTIEKRAHLKSRCQFHSHYSLAL